ncbi:MAG: ABC transporter permease [Coriobacteriia bacterium]|nr:ABC transporter permease [Coriobacteriia bacterium]
MSIQFSLAWRYLIGRGMRTLLTTLAVSLGVTVIFGLNGLLPTMLDAFRSSTLGAAGQVDITITSDTGESFSSDVAREAARVNGVAAALPVLRRAVNLPLEPGADPATSVSVLQVVGIDVRTAPKVRVFPVSEGRALSAGDGDSVVLASDLAGRLGARVGSELSLPSSVGTQRLRVVGLLSAPTLPGGEEVFVPLPSAQRLFGLPQRINAVELKVAPGADRAAVEVAVGRAVGPRYKLGGAGTFEQLLASIQVGEAAFNMFGVFALAAGAFIILNTFRTVVSERRRDVGMLRALGAKRSTVVGMFLLEAAFQGVLGTLTGLIFGYLMAEGLIASIRPFYSQFIRGLTLGGPQFTLTTWVSAIGLGMAVTLLAALFPALSAGRVTPLEAMRPQVGAVYELASRRRAWVGAALALLALAMLATRDGNAAAGGAVLFLVAITLAAPALVHPLAGAFGNLLDIGFEREGELARSNLRRNPSRSGITASVVMMGLAMIIAMLGVFSSIFTGFIDYLDKSLGADFLLMPQSIILSQGNVGAGPRLAEEIRHAPGIGAVATLRLSQGTVDGSAVQAIGIDPVAYPKVASFEWSRGSDQSAIASLDSGRQLIANGVYAAQKGIAPGDRLLLETPSGPKSYRVAAIGSDYLNAKLATVYVSQGMLKRDFGVTTDLLIMADRKPGTDLAAARGALDSIVRDFPAFRVYGSQEWRAEQLKVFDQSMTAMYALVVALALPSLLALMNTLAMSVVARTREIGMLRAVGSTQRQVRRMIMAESLLLASIGTFFGVLAGVWLGYALVEAMNTVGFPMPYAFPWAGIAIAIVVGIVFAVIAAILPARQASRLDVVDALHYE